MKSEGFLDDKERESLKEKGLTLAIGTLERLYEDNFEIYKAFALATSEVFLSYVSADQKGASERPSNLIYKIKKIFVKLKEQSDIIKKESRITNQDVSLEELTGKLRELKEGYEIEPVWISLYHYYMQNKETKEKLKKALSALEYTNLTSSLQQETSKKLYGDVLNVSVSKLEQYRSCPFSFFLKYGLKLSEKNNFKIQAIDTGSFMHEVIDAFFKQIKEYDIKAIEEEEYARIIEDIIEEKLSLNKNYIFTSTKKFNSLTNRLKKVMIKSIKYIMEGLKQSKFELLETEVEFCVGTDLSDEPDSPRMQITGKIDRVDLAKNEDGTYLRIIDYKSSIKNIDLNEVLYGVQLQLLTYLDIMCGEDKTPARSIVF